MATKWKSTEAGKPGGRVRAAAGFLAFFLGVSLVLNGAAGLWGSLNSRSGRQWARDALRAHQTSYQDTTEFRNYMAGYLARFLSMAAGGPVSGQYSRGSSGELVYDYGYGYDSYWYDTGDIYAGTGEASTVTQVEDRAWYDLENLDDLEDLDDLWNLWEDLREALDDLEDLDNLDNLWNLREVLEALENLDRGAVDDTPDAPRDYFREADAAHRYFQEDKNVLYRISYDGELKYANTEETLDACPEGYNFLLRFENGKVTITQDGKELDVYGDGYYTEDSDWYVPGYRNFTVDGQTAKAVVVMAAAEQPAIYIRGNYSRSGAEQEYNQLYWLARNLEQHRQDLLGKGIGLGAGVVLLAVYLLLRRDKARADRAIAKVTGKAWFEVKILLLLAAFFFLLPRSEYVVTVWQEVAYAYDYAIPWSEYGWIFQEQLDEWLNRPLALCGLFWVCYLGVNDLRYGDKPWRRGIIAMLCAWGLSKPIEKRLSRICGVTALTVLLLGAANLNLLVWNTSYGGTLPLETVWCVILPAALLILASAVLIWRLRRLWNDIGALTGQIEAVRAGNLTDALPLPEDADLRRAAEQLNDIQQGMAEALDQQTRSERMKVELIANVSHDLKTPLTSIISYGELLSQEEDLPDHVRDYVRILNEKALRLKTMVQDVFELSKAHSGQLPVKLETLDLGKLLRQTMADMAEEIGRAPVTLKADVPEEPVPIVADGSRLYRVFQNLIQNALKYSLEGSRVYLTLETRDGKAVASVKNTSRSELPEGVDFTERFVRGDESRTDGGSGLGLSIAGTFTEACGGTLRVEPIADLFVAVVEFPLETAQPLYEPDKNG